MLFSTGKGPGEGEQVIQFNMLDPVLDYKVAVRISNLTTYNTPAAAAGNGITNGFGMVSKV